MLRFDGMGDGISTASCLPDFAVTACAIVAFPEEVDTSKMQKSRR
jgi:hypothetical protein